MSPIIVSALIVWLLARPAQQPQAMAQQAPAVAPDVRAAMEAIDRALGVECTHCHVQDQWTDATKPAFGTAKNMIAMVKTVNEQLGEIGQVSCWTCHGGQQKPSRLPG